MATHFRCADFIEKMRSSDKDYRFMAVNDIKDYIDKGSLILDDSSEIVVLNQLLEMLTDKCAEVQNMVVQCISTFASHISEKQCESIFTRLTAIMVEGKMPDHREIASITLLKSLKEFKSGKNVSFNRVAKLLLRLFVNNFNNIQDKQVTEQVLEMLTFILVHGGTTLNATDPKLKEALFSNAQNERIGIRKRAQQAISAYVDIVDKKQLHEIFNEIYASCVQSTKDLYQLKTYVGIVAAIVKSGGKRFEPFVGKFIELFINAGEYTTDDDFREAVLYSFEIFFLRTPEGMQPYTDRVTHFISSMLSYDPNYTYDSPDQDDSMDVDDHDEGCGSEEDDEDSDFSDDDDVSWKVRKAAAKCIEAIVLHKAENLLLNYKTFGPLLIKRFKEREEIVKVEVLNAYMALLKQTRLLVPDNVLPVVLRPDTVDLAYNPLIAFNKFIKGSFNPERQLVFEELHAELAVLVPRIASVQRTKNVKVIEQSFVLLTSLLRTYPGSLGGYLPKFIAGIKISLAERSTTSTKSSALRFLAAYFSSHLFVDYVQSLEEIYPVLIPMLEDNSSKLASEAMEAINFLLRSLGQSDVIEANQGYVTKLYELLSAKLIVADMDQEIKEKTILGSAFLLAYFGHVLGHNSSSIIAVLVERLKNEISRQVALRALTIVVRTPQAYTLRDQVPTILPQLASFLRKTNRSLKIHTLAFSQALAERREGGELACSGASFDALIAETTQLIQDDDLQIAQLALKLLATLVSSYPNQIGAGFDDVIGKAFELANSSLLQGSTRRALINFFAAVMGADKVPTRFDTLISKVISIVDSGNGYLHRNAIATLAKTTAAIAQEYGDVEAIRRVTVHLSKAVSTSRNSNYQVFGILAIGEIGSLAPDVFGTGSHVDPGAVAVSCFNSNSEELKFTAAQTLGLLAVGNAERYLPFILQQIESLPMQQYFFIYALKELITSDVFDSDEGIVVLDKHLPTIWNVLTGYMAANEESTRAVVAECLSKICLTKPETYIRRIVANFDDASPLVRKTVLVVVRYMVQDTTQSSSETFDRVKEALGVFIQGLTDQDIEIRRLAIIFVNTAAHHKPELIRDLLDQALPHIYTETNQRKELQRVIEMGPFKHPVDDGLELRKSAFECLYTLVEHCLDRLSLNEFIKEVIKGVSDVNFDIKQLAYLTLIRLSEMCPDQLAGHVEGLYETMRLQLNFKPKENTVKQETDRNEELKRSVVRAVLAFKSMPTNERLPRINDLYELLCSESFSGILHEVRNELSNR